jgi:hypothetical protein
MPLQLLSPDTLLEVRDVDLPDVASPCEDVTYTVRQMSPAIAREMAKKHTKRRPNSTTHRMEEILDREALGEDVIDYVLVNWTGVLMPDGTPAPCTAEHKSQGLDGARKIALANIAGSNAVREAEARADSFRRPA